MQDRVNQLTADLRSIEDHHKPRFTHARFQEIAGLAKRAAQASSPQSRDEELDNELMKLWSRRTEHELAKEQRRYETVFRSFPFIPALGELEAERRDCHFPTGRETAEKLSEIEDHVVVPKDCSALDAHRALKLLGEAEETAQEWYENRSGFEPDFTWWCEKPYKKLSDKLKAVKTELEEKAGYLDGKPQELVGEPIGRDALEKEIGLELIGLTSDQLIELAERDLAWAQEQSERAARELGCRDWSEGVTTVKERQEAPGKQHFFVKDLILEAIDFVKKHDLVTLDELCRETWRIDMLSPEHQRVLPFAAYGGNRMLVAAPHQTMDADAKEAALSTNNRHFIRAITHHEMIPGHHLQLWMAQRHHPHRELFRTPFFVEGWTLHWEMVMWEKGFARGPEDRIGMMFWRMHRAARIVVSLRFHREEMTPNEMVETLVEQVGFELDAAKGEVRRFIGDDYPPLYQCAYLIGGYQMHALYREMLSRGWSEKEFHDQALRQGSIPIALLRQLFLGEPISLDEAPRWRFEDPPAYEEPS